MTQHIRNVILLSCILSVSFIPFVSADSELLAGEAVLEKGIGTVEILKSGTDSWVASYDNMILQEGDRIRTIGEESAASIRFQDNTVVQVTGEADLSIPEIRSQEEGPGKKTVLDLKKGALRAVFTKLKPGEESHFEVKTPTSVCGVLGTTIYIDSSTGSVYVAEGTLTVRNNATGEEYTVEAGEIISIAPDGSTGGAQGATEEQVQHMLNNFAGLDINILGYSLTGDPDEDEFIIFTPGLEEAATRT